MYNTCWVLLILLSHNLTAASASSLSQLSKQGLPPIFDARSSLAMTQDQPVKIYLRSAVAGSFCLASQSWDTNFHVNKDKQSV